jgi:hypothetical protein
MPDFLEADVWAGEQAERELILYSEWLFSRAPARSAAELPIPAAKRKVLKKKPLLFDSLTY